MYKCLSPGAINLQTKTLEESLVMARAGEFTGLEISPGEIADRVDRDGADAVKQVFAEAGIRPAAFGLPVEWRKDDERWQTDLEPFPRLAKAAAAIGVKRCFTWVLPFSNDLPLAENKKFHIERFKPIADALGQHGISLGLEFIGPKTLRDGQKFEFIYKMHDMLDLARQIAPNVGLLLDCWHWYTSHGTLEEIKKLQAKDVVYVHVNDAPRGIEIDRQIDNTRELPGVTGVIDIAGFLKALKQIGYDGPVTPEPFKQELSDLPDDQARMKQVGAAMNDIFAKAGLI